MDDFGKLAKELEDTQKALAALDGEIGKVKINPDDPKSVEQAIKKVYLMIDEKVNSFNKNSISSSIIEGIKSSYKEEILKEAENLRKQN